MRVHFISNKVFVSREAIVVFTQPCELQCHETLGSLTLTARSEPFPSVGYQERSPWLVTYSGQLLTTAKERFSFSPYETT